MKKTFKMSHPKIKLPRLVEAIKYEVKKYMGLPLIEWVNPT
jgi:hypothetical protein